MSQTTKISRLTLGTVAQGMRYGAVNISGEPTAGSAGAVFDAAADAGINCFDTARAYGEAEARLGAWMARRKSDAVLISKLPATGEADAATVPDNFRRTTEALARTSLFGYLCHRAADFSNAAIRRELERLRDQGRIARLGASLYTASELAEVLSVKGAGIVQLPLSIADTEIVRSGLIQQAAEDGILLFVRSVFLQGVLLAEPQQIPQPLAALREPVHKLRRLAAAAGTSPAAIALAAVDQVAGVHSIIVGAETPEQVERTIATFSAARPNPEVLREAASLFANLPAELIDPSRWPPL